jgi:integrase/recombinase XerD
MIMAAKKKKEINEIRDPMKKDRIFNELYESVELPEITEMERMQKKYVSWMLNHNFAQGTIKDYGYSLFQFVEWCRERGILRPQEVTREILEHLQGQLTRYRKDNGEPYSPKHMHKLLSIIKGFFRWLAKENHILYNPAAELEMPRLVKHIPHNILSIAEVEAIMMEVDLSKLLGLRDRAMLETLYSTGMRRSELCRLKCSDILGEAGVVLIQEGKGGKDRMIPIGERALAWVEKYIDDLRPVLVTKEDEGILFLSCWGKPFNPSSINMLLGVYIRAAGIEKKGSCHLFRHTMATLMLENGADIRYIQQILGHSSLTTTQIYTHVAIKKLKEVHSATHPGANLKSQVGGKP